MKNCGAAARRIGRWDGGCGVRSEEFDAVGEGLAPPGELHNVGSSLSWLRVSEGSESLRNLSGKDSSLTRSHDTGRGMRIATPVTSVTGSQ